MSLNIPLTIKTQITGTNISSLDITKELVVTTKKEMTLELQLATGEVSINFTGVSNPALIIFQSDNDFSVKFTLTSGMLSFPCNNGIPFVLPIDSTFIDSVEGTTLSTESVNIISVQCGIYGIES